MNKEHSCIHGKKIDATNARIKNNLTNARIKNIRAFMAKN